MPYNVCWYLIIKYPCVLSSLIFKVIPLLASLAVLPMDSTKARWVLPSNPYTSAYPSCLEILSQITNRPHQITRGLSELQARRWWSLNNFLVCKLELKVHSPWRESTHRCLPNDAACSNPFKNNEDPAKTACPCTAGEEGPVTAAKMLI